MTPANLVFLVIAAALIVSLPRRAAVVPLLLAAAYTTRQPIVELGPASLSVLRVLVLIGFARAAVRGEYFAHGLNAVDWLLFAWATLLVGMSVFHTSDAWTFRLGLMLGEVGAYILCRIFIQSVEDVRWLFKVLSVALVPLAGLMLLEKELVYNFFSIMGGSEAVIIREGHVRAAGPFGHPILAGVAGATCVPMALSLWRTNRLVAFVGFCAAAGIVFASTSSGPIMMVLFTVLALVVWNVRKRLRLIRWAAVAAIFALDRMMTDPVYFVMAKIDITGGSTGWFRAALIRSALINIGEWWAVGTDYTRHWMPSGIPANNNHTDMTNHLLAIGVMGGLPTLAMFLVMLFAAFHAVGKALKASEGRSPADAFLVWTLGAMLFGHVANFWSISLFDQSATFFYLVLATIGAVQAAQAPALAVAGDSLSRIRLRRTEQERSQVLTTGSRNAVVGWGSKVGSDWKRSKASSMGVTSSDRPSWSNRRSLKQSGLR